jgi:hypothetical protein
MKKLLLTLALTALAPAAFAGEKLIANEFMGPDMSEKFAAYALEMCPGHTGGFVFESPCGQKYYKMIESKIMLAYPKADLSKVNLECQAAGTQCKTLSDLETLIKKSHKKNYAAQQRRAFWGGLAEGLAANKANNVECVSRRVGREIHTECD